MSIDRLESQLQVHKRSGSAGERVPVLIFDDPGEIALQAARRIRTLIQEKDAANEYAVLGLPTGSTPIGVYHELARMHREEGLDFTNVITFNLDEYYPIQPDSLQSYRRFMMENLFDHINVRPENIRIPRGDITPEEVEHHCAEYEREISKAGGIDLLLLGVGRSGHVGFNEPGSEIGDRTRLIVLDEITRKDAASDFFEERYVPREAITMGVGTILEAKEIILIATGEHKAPIIRRAVEETPTTDVSATYLQLHPDATFYLDRAAAGQLTREQTPWLVRQVHWDDHLAKRAVIWLSEKVGKSIQWLEVSDFHQNHLHSLVHAYYGGVDELCRSTFEDLRRRIWYRKDLPASEKIIVFSPHPDDDVISMGGTLLKLAQNGNDIKVAYMTNGSVAVFDGDVSRHLRFVEMTAPMFVGEQQAHTISEQVDRIEQFFREKEPASVDLKEVQDLKAYIRYTEAVAGIEVIGLNASCARFLDMPFYKTGRVKKDAIDDDDIQIVLDLLEEIQPAHVFVAGDLSDPHGTHRMCYSAIEQALVSYNAQASASSGGGVSADERGADENRRPPMVWLYRGAWQEWEIDRADVFVPLSKADLDKKIEAIYKHESQKDRALFPGAYDEREFWQRARDRNRNTAVELDKLGLPEFYAAEAFVVTNEL
jgi:glucosamine-6-phosphate deaminase